MLPVTLPWLNIQTLNWEAKSHRTELKIQPIFYPPPWTLCCYCCCCDPFSRAAAPTTITTVTVMCSCVTVTIPQREIPGLRIDFVAEDNHGVHLANISQVLPGMKHAQTQSPPYAMMRIKSYLQVKSAIRCYQTWSKCNNSNSHISKQFVHGTGASLRQETQCSWRYRSPRNSPTFLASRLGQKYTWKCQPH